MSRLAVTLYTDPTCPFALSAEPRRMRLAWLYGDQLRWELAPIVLRSERRAFASPDEGGFTREAFQAHARELRAAHGMPIEDAALERIDELVSCRPASRAIVAAELHGEQGDAARMLQALREQYWVHGARIDEDAVIIAAGERAGVPQEELGQWLADPAVDARLDELMERARTPAPAARVLDHRLSDAEDGRRRYSAPTLEVVSLATQSCTVAPGFVHADAYEVLLANAAPDLERRDEPSSAREVLEWAQRPLALAEIAAIMDVSAEDAQHAVAGIAEDVHGWVSLRR